MLREVQRELSAKYGRPWHRGEPVGLAVIAMGKLGGAELNYSSDIDLIFVYGKDGETDGGTNAQPITNREFFHRLCERMSREFNAVSAHGKLYRCDLRLRPEGSLGSLVRTLAASVAYYRQSGETWERQAFLKARPIAGDRTIGDEFVARVREWAYGRCYDTSARRRDALYRWLLHYNFHRAHSSLGGQPPISRIPSMNNAHGIHS